MRRGVDAIRAATTDAELLAALSRGFASPFSAHYGDDGQCTAYGSYESDEKPRRPRFVCGDTFEDAVTYEGKALAALTREALGIATQADLFARPIGSAA